MKSDTDELRDKGNTHQETGIIMTEGSKDSPTIRILTEAMKKSKPVTIRLREGTISRAEVVFMSVDEIAVRGIMKLETEDGEEAMEVNVAFYRSEIEMVFYVGKSY